MIAGLPDIAFDGGKVVYTIDNFREDVYPMLSAEDAKCIDLFFLARDNDNLLKLLREGNEVVFEKAPIRISFGHHPTKQWQL